jgi:hypothetical protein
MSSAPRARPASTRRAGTLALSLAAGCALLGGGCQTAPVFAPPPPLRAASASGFVVDVEFAEPLDRASAEQPARYRIYPAGDPAAAVALQSAALIDSLYGRTVELVIDPSGGALPDSADYEVETADVLTLSGNSTGVRTIHFRTGLSHRDPLGVLFADHCNACHGPAQVQGAYRTDSYEALFGSGTDATPDLIAGDTRCLLVRKCKPLNSMFDAGRLSFLDYAMIANWVGGVYRARE